MAIKRRAGAVTIDVNEVVAATEKKTEENAVVAAAEPAPAKKETEKKAPAKRGGRKKADAADKTAAKEETKTAKKTAAKKTTRKTTAKKTTAKKTTVKKTAAKKDGEKKTTTRRAASKVSEAFVVQFRGREVSADQIKDRFKDVWTKDYLRKMSDVKDVAFYIKPEDSAVYFAVNNGEDTGSFAI